MQMVARTIAQLNELKVPKESYHTVLTKASIVERVAKDQYYGQVARVIENRLEQVDDETQGKLQMDSTVLYGLGRSGGIPTSAELADANNVYNTYAHQGFRPDPSAALAKAPSRLCSIRLLEVGSTS